MALMVPDCGELKTLAKVKTWLETCDVHIYVNNYTPVAADLADASNYTPAASMSSQHPAWNAPATVGGKASMSLAAAMNFVQTAAVPGGQTAFGYYVTDPADGNKLVMAERFSTSITLTAIGDGININTLDYRLYNP